jgi:hypothetical protein
MVESPIQTEPMPQAGDDDPRQRELIHRLLNTPPKPRSPKRQEAEQAAKLLQGNLSKK